MFRVEAKRLEGFTPGRGDRCTSFQDVSVDHVLSQDWTAQLLRRLQV